MFWHHLKGNWPLAAAALLLLIYLPFVLVRGVFLTNQGNILRGEDPRRYWRWVTLISVLLGMCLLVLIISYALSRGG